SSRSITRALKFSTSTSATDASRAASAFPPSALRLTVIDRLLRSVLRKEVERSRRPVYSGGRRTAPVASGLLWDSTVATSAPRSARMRVQYGPARMWLKSSTRTPASGPPPCGALDGEGARLVIVSTSGRDGGGEAPPLARGSKLSSGKD